MSDQIISALENRFACKSYDPAGHVSDSDFNTILEAGRLSPSSFGLEPWKFLVIQDRDLIDEIRARSWGIKMDADRTVILLTRRSVNARSTWVHRILHDIQGYLQEDEIARLEKLEAFQRDDLHILDSDRTLFDWAGKQTYLALSNMLTTAALLGIDSTPIEGFSAERMNALLSERGLIDPEEWGISAMVQFGIHDPNHRPHPKQRRPFTEVVEYVRPRPQVRSGVTAGL
ncbi:NAD(P)H-dependent oxidoreductase [Coriobacterium glomerans]|nr:NAD(P)H-dependent oxidoreductase [Coriobacterium glomerans]